MEFSILGWLAGVLMGHFSEEKEMENSILLPPFFFDGFSN
jgi:hypothetical protein